MLYQFMAIKWVKRDGKQNNINIWWSSLNPEYSSEDIMFQDLDRNRKGSIVRESLQVTILMTVNSTISIPIRVIYCFWYNMDDTAPNGSYYGVYFSLEECILSFSATPASTKTVKSPSNITTTYTSSDVTE